MKDDTHTIESGHLAVGDGHKIYYQRWGNPKGKPIFFLHGGPGSGCKDKYKLTFDPAKHHVIFHDQRGSGQSTPFASLENNTSHDLVDDIEKLRKKFNFNSIQLLGHSWGSTLAMLYAISYSERVERMLLSGIFNGTREEINYIQQGGARTHYPEGWNDYISLVPEENRDDTASYYLDKMCNGTQEEIEKHVISWNRWETSAMSIDSDYPSVYLSSLEYEDSARSLAILEAHYFVNDCFIDDEYILRSARNISIPTVIIHGRYDHVCTPENAYKLAKAIGDSCHLHFVPNSHARESALREVQKAYAWSFLG